MKAFALSRPCGRFLFLVTFIVWIAAGMLHADRVPAKTLVSDTLFRADGSPAAGNILISWPSFTTSDGLPVAAGVMKVGIDGSGGVAVSLIPNQGAIPSGSFYRVVLQLDDGTTTTESWVIPTNSPAKIADVRSTLLPTAVAAQVVTKDLLEASLEVKADDLSVLHNAGDESVAGVKQFTQSPLVPFPTIASAAATKSYVDTAVAGATSGSYVQRTGDTMTGALKLYGDPVAMADAADRHYVDTQVAGLGSSVMASAEQVTNKGQASGYAALDANAMVPNGNVNWASPGSVGATAPNAATFTNVSAKTLNNIRFADQYGGLTDAAIQAAVNDAPDGGEVYLIPGTWNLCNSLPITITKRVTFRGAGWSTALSVCSSASASTDIITVAPKNNGVVSGFKLADFAIFASGAPGRYGIHFDGTNGEVVLGVVDHVYIQKLGSYAIYGDGSGLAQGTPTMTTIQNSLLTGGIGFANAGDTVRVINNNITGAGYAINVTGFQPGASSFIAGWNNITSDKGLHFGTNTIAPQIIGNEIETLSTFTGSNGALVDIDGASGNVATDALITGNSFQVVNGITADAVRINYALRANLFGNRFGRGTGSSHDITITANATYTNVGTNLWASGTPWTSMVNNAGAGTMIAAIFQGGFVTSADSGVQGLNDQHNTQPLMQVNSANGTNSIYGYHGNLLMVGVNGAAYLYDSGASNNVVAVGGTASSAAPVSGTWLSVDKLQANSGVKAGSTTVGSLPAASANPGLMRYVTDSTPITSEGQACTGGGSTVALAFSNGSTWKCF